MASSERESNEDDPARTMPYQPPFKSSEQPPLESSGSRFRKVRKLGEGGMGEVWLAEDLELKCEVALKQPHANSLLDHKFHARFVREGQAAVHLRHPALCRIYETIELDGRPCIVMQYVKGESLASALSSRGVFDEAEAVRIVLAVALGLAEAHALGVIHRDLKPGNIVLAANQDPVVVEARFKKYQHRTFLEASDGEAITAEVGSYQANPFGLFDMHGNVWEWCQDWFTLYAGPAALSEDPTGPVAGHKNRVLRGGSWDDEPRFTRSAYRSRYTPSYRNHTTGFRVVISPRIP